MKKILGFLFALVMMCSVLTTTAFADGYVVSPEPGGDTPPSSPQTGYETGIGAVAGIAAIQNGVDDVDGSAFVAADDTAAKIGERVLPNVASVDAEQTV